jgi:hypothetical protein
MKELTGTVKTAALDFTSLGMAAMGVGTIFNLLGGLTDKLGLEGLGKALKSVGSIMVGVGSAALMLGPILKMLGWEFTLLGLKINGAIAVPMAAIIGIVAALAALVGVFALIKNSTPEAQLNKAKEAA